jgi:isopenicillin N synthase-like dioxygenase
MEDREALYLRARRSWTRKPCSVIPVVDLSPLTSGERGAEEVLAKELREAQENIGFYFLKNHGLSNRLLVRTFAAVEDFHALPLKSKLALIAGAGFSGYMPLSGTLIKNSYVGTNTKPDLSEAITFMRDFPEDNLHVMSGRAMMGPNKWPHELPWFKPIIKEYMTESIRLAYRLLPIYALALGASADYFEDKFDDPSVNLRAGHYPPIQAPDDQLGLGAHTDLGFFTLLPQSRVGGLEVQTLSGDWIAVPMNPGYILVNGGDTLARFSNGKFLATPHRVLPNPGPEHRYSIPIFFQPNFSTVVAPMSSCVGVDHPSLFEAVRFGDYREGYISQVSDRYASKHAS